MLFNNFLFKNLKIIILLIAFISVIQLTKAQVCSDPFNVIYGMNQSGDVVPINVHNASVGSKITSSRDDGYPGSTTNSNGIGLCIQTSTFYFFQKNTESRHSPSKFVSYNTITHTYTTLAESPISDYDVRGCITADGTGYYCLDGSNTLCYYNIAADKWTKISSNLKDQHNNDLSSTFQDLSSGDMAVDGVGRLWIVAASASKWGIYMMDAPLPTTAKSSLLFNEQVVPTQPTPTNDPFGGIAYNATGQMYMSTQDNLYLLNDDLSITHVGAFSSSGVGADLTSCNFPFSVLAMGWKNFTAQLNNNNSVKLTWSLRNNINIHEYHIERSTNGQNWSELGSLKNAFPNENSFTFLDSSPYEGTNYYRLKASSVNGKIIYSKIIVQNIKTESKLRLWPVPATSFINIEIPGSEITQSGIAEIFSPSGQPLISTELFGGKNSIDLSKLSNGFYIARIRLKNGKAINKKIIKK